ncbi:MAG: glycosyltransferase family 39 protein [Anaerolineaceae bacterium]|nr:glycosyltransferase family 39 protein [Anaerolineaceae bacterium]
MKAEHKKPTIIAGRIILLCSLAVLIILSVGFSLLPSAWLKQFLDSFSADGSIESLTISLLSAIQPMAMILALIFLAGFLLFLLRKSLYQQCLDWISSQWHALLQDCHALFSAINKRLKRRDLWLDVLFLFFIAALLRFMWLERPLEHDEAFTYYVFGRLPLRYAIADYSFPNNHILHTILLKASVAIFGNHSWAMRLPAYLFGSAAAPFLYLFARYTTRQRWTGVLAGGLAALYPYMVYYSSNARGYTMLAAFTILGALLASAMMQHKNRLLWMLFSLLITAGLYTMPIMLLPAGGLFTWLLWLGFSQQHDAQYGRWGWLKYMIFSGVLIIFATLLIYLPVFRYSGIESLIANPNVAPLTSSAFIPTLRDRLKDTWQEWQSGLPLWIILPAVAAMLLGFFSPHKKTRQSGTIIPTFLIFLVVYSIVQKPNLWPRVTYYLVPFLILGLAYGLTTLYQWITRGRTMIHTKKWVLPSVIVILAVISLFNTPNYNPIGKRILGDTEQQAEWLAQHWQEDQLILIDYPEDMAFSVYMERIGLPPTAIRWEQPFRGAYVIINKPEKQTVAGVIKENGPEITFFDLSAAELIIDYPNSVLYYVPGYWDLVQDAYQ